MSKVNIKGVILQDNWYMESGVTTLADFQREINQCKDSIELEIDSQGGDVFTSNCMSTMLSDWAIRHPNAKATCIVGGLCASAAANILAKLPACFQTECYEDSLIMYHSAWGVVEGSPETLRDNALLMDLVNSVVITKLLDKTTLDSNRVHDAFKAGREMWLDGKEAVSCGLVNSIRGGNADTTIINASYEEANGTDAYRYVAAVVKNIKSKLEARKTMAEEIKEEVKAEETTQVTAEVTNTPVAEAKAECEEEEKKEEAKAECEEKEEAKAEAETEEEEPKAEEEDDEVKALRAENESLKAEVNNLKAIVAKYNPTATTAQAQAVKTDWLTLVKELNAKHLNENEYAKEYIALKNAHKSEFDAFMSNHTSR